MIQILDLCNIAHELLTQLSKNGTIKDFRIFLRRNENMYINILIHDKKMANTDELEKLVQEKTKDHCKIEIIDTEDLEEDDYYKDMFNKKDEIKIILDKGRRRYNNIWRTKNTNPRICPIISFYSYKGGMGRTTTLAAYASYLAIHHKKKVVIIDCDIEAPGFTNFFLSNPSEINQRQGLIEYIFDKETHFVGHKDVRNYFWEVDHSFTDEGTIYVMPCGNLDANLIDSTKSFGDTHLDHYIEGIARLDLSNSEYAKEVFIGVVNDIYSVVNPDVILIDSRTGISDIMGIAICELANKVVGFFRGDLQTLPGLQFFIKCMHENAHIDPFIVNSILPSGIKGKKLFNKFKNDISDIIETISPKSDEYIQSFPISRIEELSLIGTPEEEVGEFAELIRNDLNKEYTELFEALTKSIVQNVDTLPVLSKENCRKLQKSILLNNQHLFRNIDLYADSVNIKADLENGIFYYRRCMGDLLNLDKFLILGSKGTGKSYIYNALKEQSVIEHIKSCTSKQGKFLFTYTIDRRNRILHTDKIDGSVSAAARYRYWVIYTWNAIANDIKDKLLDFNFDMSSLKFTPNDTDESRLVLQKLIEDEQYVQHIESEFTRLDEFLKSQAEPTYLTIIYDQLDEIVKPSDWNIWIPDLIRYWRMKRYTHISGKLFMRTDLFKSLEGVNNINDLINNAINIEWQKEELFSFFFQLALLGNNASSFWEIMNAYGDYDQNIIKGCKDKFDVTKSSLIPIDDKSLIPMVYTYFGEFVDVNKSSRMGDSYDWFYRNLKNADGTISIRPFISLLKTAINKACKEIHKIESYKPVLFQKCYTDREVRSSAVSEHLEDMQKDMVGGKYIALIFDFINNTRELKYKKISQREPIFISMLKEVVKSNNSNTKEDISIDFLKDLLIRNGIVGVTNYGSGNIYVFSFLYKYILGLKGS